MGKDVYYDARKLPRVRNEYVAFIDIMGTRTHMKFIVKKTANFIVKHHSMVSSSLRQKPYNNVFVYAMTDKIMSYLESIKVENNPLHYPGKKRKTSSANEGVF